MNRALPAIDPEALGILDEIIADPKSSLLRRPKVKCAQIMGMGDEGVSVGANFLTNAERHLLERYREEVAHLLYEAALHQLYAPGTLATQLHRAPRAVPSEWRERATRLRARDIRVGLSNELDMVCDGRGAESGAYDLISASLRISPSDATRLVLALVLRKDGRSQKARATLHSILKASPRARTTSLCHANLGLMAADEKDFDSALAAYKKSCLGGEPTAWMWCYWLVFGMREGSVDDVHFASSHVEELAQAHDVTIGESLAVLRRDKAVGYWHPTSQSIQTLPRLVDKLPSRAQDFVHAVL